MIPASELCELSLIESRNLGAEVSVATKYARMKREPRSERMEMLVNRRSSTIR